MDPREAMDMTIRAFNLKATDIARDSGVTVQMLSRYRKKRQDMTSLNVFQVIRALPPDAQNLFWLLSTHGDVSDLSEKPDLAEFAQLLDARQPGPGRLKILESPGSGKTTKLSAFIAEVRSRKSESNEPPSEKLPTIVFIGESGSYSTTSVVEDPAKSKEIHTTNNETDITDNNELSNLGDIAQYSEGSEISHYTLDLVIEGLVLKYLNKYVPSIISEELKH